MTALSHLASPGLTVVQVAEVEHSEDQVSKVQVLVQGLEEEEMQVQHDLKVDSP